MKKETLPDYLERVMKEKRERAMNRFRRAHLRIVDDKYMRETIEVKDERD